MLSEKIRDAKCGNDPISAAAKLLGFTSVDAFLEDAARRERVTKHILPTYIKAYKDSVLKKDPDGNIIPLGDTEIPYIPYFTVARIQEAFATVSAENTPALYAPEQNPPSVVRTSKKARKLALQHRYSVTRRN